MLYIGCHLSASKGYKDMGKQALKINANTFAFFTRNPRGGSAKAINQSDIDAFMEIYNENKFSRHARLRIWWATVQVQVLYPAPIYK